MKKSLIITFYTLILFFLLILGEIFVEEIGELFKGSLFFLLPFVIFSLLGVLLIFLVLKQNIKGGLKKYLSLTGVSAISFFIFVFLHNVFYGLAEISSNIILLKNLMEVLYVIFFIIAIFICPLGFLIGSINSIIVFIKNRKKDIIL
jgi:hypothetical protein